MDGRPKSEIELTTFGSTTPDWDQKKRKSKASFGAEGISAKRSSSVVAGLDLATPFKVGVPSPAKKASRDIEALNLATPHGVGVPSPAKKTTPSLSAPISTPQRIKDNVQSTRNAFGLNAPTLALMAGVKSPKVANKIADHWQKAISTHDKMLDKVLPHMQGMGGGAMPGGMAAQHQNMQNVINKQIGKVMSKNIAAAIALPKSRIKKT